MKQNETKKVPKSSKKAKQLYILKQLKEKSKYIIWYIIKDIIIKRLSIN
jgi:hypothetical protein